MSASGADDAVARRRLVAELLSRQVQDGVPSGAMATLEHLCRAARSYLDVGGVSIGLMAPSGPLGRVAGADAGGMSIADLQFTLGEGPGIDAYELRRPVLVSDLRSSDGDRWPIYRSAALDEGVEAVFALPLHVGAAAFGVMTIHHVTAGSLAGERLTMALEFAAAATDILLDQDSEEQHTSVDAQLDSVMEHHAVIFQAQGALMVDAGVTLAAAMSLMRAHAFATDQPLLTVASSIMNGDLRLGPDQSA